MMDIVRTIRIILEYDGGGFLGWQIQDAGRTVQGELEAALRTLLGHPIQLVGSGRTDAGTHALGQVAHFHTSSKMPVMQLQRSLNGILPVDIAVHAVDQVQADFHARFSAKRKRYRYRIHRGKAALDRAQVWTLFRPLDLQAMQEAVAALPGVHSFGAFCKQDPVPANLECRIFSACLWEQGRELIFEIEGNRFLRHMVRIIVGTLSEIGLGKRSPADMSRLLLTGDRRAAGITAPACGLCLVHVAYAATDLIPSP